MKKETKEVKKEKKLDKLLKEVRKLGYQVELYPLKK